MTHLTVLRAVPSRPLTKTVSQKTLHNNTTEYIIGQYDQQIAYFSGEEWPVSSFDELSAALDKLIKDKYSCVIRGSIKEGVHKDSFRRRKTSNQSEGCIEDVDQNWVCLDIDSMPLASLGVGLMAAPEAIRNFLPTCFRNAACWWNFSASQGFKPGNKVSVHLWFWLDDETSNNELKRYFELFNESAKEFLGIEKLVDIVLFDSIQIHYTAPPDLIGLEDPLLTRHGVLAGTPSVKLAEDWLKCNVLDVNSANKHLNRIGDDKDGFHSPLLSASAAWVRIYGYGENSNKEFKMLARDYIDRADKSSHSEQQIERYSSDAVLDQLLKSASLKGFDKGVLVLDHEARELFKNIIYCETTNKFYKVKEDVWVSTEAFDNAARVYLKSAGGTKVFMDAGGEKVDVVMTIPGEEVRSVITWRGKRVYNKWPGRIGAMMDAYDASPFEEHISFLCDNRPDVTNLLLDYMAYIISKPGEKIKWAPIIGSETQGIGKSIIKIPFKKIFNGGTVEIGTEDLKNQFNSYMEKELAFIEEVYDRDNRSLANQIKARITEDTARINIKGMPQYEAPNFINFILFTNHRVPFPIDKTDRRFLIIHSEANVKEQGYYNKLVRWLENSTDHIFTWAHRRDLKGFDPNRPPLSTREKQESIDFSESFLMQELKHAKEDIIWPLQHDVINVNKLLHYINESEKRQFTVQYLTQELKKIGAVKFDKFVVTKADGVRGRIAVWVIRDIDRYMKMSSAEMLTEVEDKVIGLKRDYYSHDNM